MTHLKYLVILSFLYLAGCSHPIVITARTDKLPEANANLVKKNVGYYISQTNLDLAVTTPGGGGDDISYQPYRDLDAGIYKVLLNIYSHVVKLKSNDKNEITKNNISYVFIPEVKTTSSSDGLFTWPATDFEINMTMVANDAAGKKLWSKVITAKGHADYKEFMSDFQLSSRRATESLLKKLQAEINASGLK